jgi:protoporphyrinogen/coproporphyrinogen III oxidase
VLEINGPSIDRVVWRNPRALPQYNVGHARRVAQIADALRDLPNLHIAGNYLTGRSIGDCVQIAFRVADDLHSRYQR